LSTGEEVPRYIRPECDYMGVNTLMAMGLEPQFEINQECPCSWKWPEQKANTCIYKGKYYKHGEDFIKKEEDSVASCKCNVRKGNPRILCETAKYTSTWEPSDRNYTCQLGNKIYNGNNKFWPENTCFTCKCKPGFQEELVPPFCQRSFSDISFLYQREISKQCTPYYDNYNDIDKPALCSPSGFICNDDLLEIRPINVIRNSTDSVTKMCKIDGESYSKGSVLNVTFARNNNDKIVNCTCLTPPVFTCVNNYHNDWMDIMPEVLD